MSWQDPNAGEQSGQPGPSDQPALGIHDATAQPGWGAPVPPAQPAQPGWGAPVPPAQPAQPGQPMSGWGAPAQPASSGWGAPVAWSTAPASAGRSHGVDTMLSDTWRVMRKGLGPLVGLSAVKLVGLLAFVPALIVAGPWLKEATDWFQQVQDAAGNPNATRLLGASFPIPPMSVIPAFLLGVLVSVIVEYVVTLGMLAMAGDVLADRPPSIGRSLMVGLRRFPTLIGLGLLWGVAAFVTIVVLAFLSFLGPLVILLWLAAITAWIYLFIRLVPVLTVMVLEEDGPLGSLGRAWSLTDGSVLLTLGFSFITWLIAVIVSQIGSYAVGLVAAAAPVLLFLASGVVGLITEPWGAVTSVILYDELRVRGDVTYEPAHRQPAAPVAPAPAIDLSGWR